MIVALIQQSASQDKPDNLERGIAATRRAAANGANVICFAELAFAPFYPQVPAEQGFEALAESIPGPTTEIFSQLAAELGDLSFIQTG